MYVVIGASGQVGRQIVSQLSARAVHVRAIVRDAASVAGLPHVQAAVGDAADVAFLTQALQGATALFTLTPPNFGAPSHSVAVDRFGSAVLAAIAASGVRKVVNLSSAGAALPAGTGPIAGLYRNEQRLNTLADVDVLHLRAATFMENLLTKIGPMQQFGVFPDMADGDVPFAMVATADIASAAVQALLQPDFTGKSVREVLGDRDYTLREAAAILGQAIGRPDIPYVKAEPADAKATMLAHGFSQDVADKFEEMAGALTQRRIQSTVKRTPGNSSNTSLQAWSAVFARAYLGH